MQLSRDSHKRLKPVLLFVLLALFMCLISAPKAIANNSQTNDVWVGDWQGQLNINSSIQLSLILHIQNNNQQLSASLDSPDQGAFGIPVNKITINEQQLWLDLDAIGASVQASLNNNVLQGTFTQRGGSLPLTLQRQSIEQAAAITEKTSRPQEPKAPYPYVEENVAYPHLSGAFNFAATLTKPNGKGPFAAAILISGSGPQDRDEQFLGHKPFKVIADYLTRQGYVVLRFDDRGTAQSTGQFENTTMQEFASDVESAYNFLLTRADIAADKIGLIGHSEGGVTGPIFAAKQPNVAFVIMLAGVGVSGKQLWATQQRDVGVASGIPNGQLIYDLHEKAAQMAIDGASEQRIIQHFMQVSGIQEDMVKPVAQLLTSTWGRSLMAYDPKPVLSKLSMPLLAINGSLDMQVASKDNLENIRTIMTTSHNNDVTTLELQGLNHMFQAAKTGHPNEYAQINETFNTQALITVSNWLKARF